MKRTLPILAVVLVLSACAPKSVLTEPGKVAYTADQIVLRVNEVQASVIQLQQAGQMPTATARTLVTFTRGTLVTLKASPGGWKPSVHAAWAAIRPELLKDLTVAPWVTTLDTILGYVVGGVQ